MNDLIDRVGPATFISKLDLLKGHCQGPLTSRASDISAFVTPDTFLQYMFMLFGPKNAPATFQPLMQHVLGDVPDCGVYLDNVVVYSNDSNSQMASLRIVFQCLAEINAIISFPVPTTRERREVRHFLGMASKNFSSVVSPLTSLCSRAVPFKWSEECEQAFSAAKSLLCSALVLVALDIAWPFKLEVDLSATGVGAVLLQDGGDDVNHPVCYFSPKFKRHQQNYSTTEKETLTMLLALQHFEVYVGSSLYPVTVYTDHNPLVVFLNQMYNSNQRCQTSDW